MEAIGAIYEGYRHNRKDAGYWVNVGNVPVWRKTYAGLVQAVKELYGVTLPPMDRLMWTNYGNAYSVASVAVPARLGSPARVADVARLAV